MNIKSMLFQKKNLWHLGAIIIFFIISISYFYPNLSGYTIKQGDIVNFIGMSREVDDYRTNDNEQILWTNAMFSGMPSTQISMVYEGNWLAKGLKKVANIGLPYPIAFLFIYFISFYILGISLRIKPYISALGAIAFGLSSYFLIILEAGHNSKAGAIGFIPLMIAGFILTYRAKKYILAAAFAAMGMLLELAANHIQITYYGAFILLFIGIIELVRAVREGKILDFLKRTGLLTVAYGFAILVNYGNIFGTLAYTKQTIRGGSELTQSIDGNTTDKVNQDGLDKDYVTNWSYGLGETFSFLVPNYKGGKSQIIGSNPDNKDFIRDAKPRFRQNIAQQFSQYWGDQPFTSGPVYIGIIVVFLALLALAYIEDKYKWALLVATLLSITLSWGKNFVSAMIIIPILLYLVNIFIDNKRRLVFNVANTTLLFFILILGTSITSTSLTDFFLDYVPGYNKLRAVTIILIIAELCIPLLGIMFLNKLIKNKESILNDLKPFYIVSGVLVVTLLGFYIMPGTFNEFINIQESNILDSIENPQQQDQYFALFNEVEIVRQGIFKADVIRSLGFLIVGIGLLFAYLKLNLNKYVLVGGLGIFIFADLFMVDNRYLSTEKRGKNYDQWTETYKQKYPFKAGAGEKAILAQEISENPDIQSKIDAAVTDLKKEFKDSEISNQEKQRRIDYLTYRVLNKNTNFRVLEPGNPYNSSYVGYFNKSIGGYHGAKLSRYQDLIEFHLSQNNQAVIDMLNTKYLIQSERDRNGNIVNSRLLSVNKNAMGNVWLAKDIQFVDNADEEIRAMASTKTYNIKSKGTTPVLVDGNPIQSASISEKQSVSVIIANQAEPTPVSIPFQALQTQSLAMIIDTAGAVNWVYDSTPDSVVQKVFVISASENNGWNPRSTTIVDKRYEDNVSSSDYSGSGTISMTSYHPDRLTYAFSSNQNELAVFSEIYYENGWKAYIDGEPVEISRVNYVLRAIEVPAGEHQIEFVFGSESYEKSGTYANIGNIGIILLLLSGLYFEIIRRQPESDK